MIPVTDRVPRGRPHGPGVKGLRRFCTCPQAHPPMPNQSAVQRWQEANPLHETGTVCPDVPCGSRPASALEADNNTDQTARTPTRVPPLRRRSETTRARDRGGSYEDVELRIETALLSQPGRQLCHAGGPAADAAADCGPVDRGRIQGSARDGAATQACRGADRALEGGIPVRRDDQESDGTDPLVGGEGRAGQCRRPRERALRHCRSSTGQQCQ